MKQFPSLKQVVVADHDGLMKLTSPGHPFVPFATTGDAFDYFVRRVTDTLDPSVTAKLCGDTSGSYSEVALRISKSFKAVDAVVRLGWPLQSYGGHSVAGLLLWDFITGAIGASEISRVLQPLFGSGAPKGLVDMHSTFKCGSPEFELNPLQLAILSGDESVFFTVLASTSDLENRDLHELVSSGGRVNLFETAVTILPSDERLLAAFKLIMARQKQLGVYISLFYEESSVDSCSLMPLERAARRRMDQSVEFLVSKGVELHPRLAFRSSVAPPSLLHCAFYDHATTPFSPAYERFILGLRECFTSEMLSKPVGTVSLLAKIVMHTSTPILKRALVAASQELKNIALSEVCDTSTLNEAHEKLLLAAGADPLHDVWSNGKNCLMLAAQRCPERATLIAQFKGAGILMIEDNTGHLAAHYASDFLSGLRPSSFQNAKAAAASVRALVAHPSIKSDKLKYVLEALQKKCIQVQIYPSCLQEFTKLRDEVEKLIKSRG